MFSNLAILQMQVNSNFFLNIKYGSDLVYKESYYIAKFEEKYERAFAKPISNQFEYAALSSLLSGLSFSTGPIRVATEHGDEYLPSSSLLSFTPSRIKFPRGFLWDDGFHLLVASDYNPLLCIQVLPAGCQQWTLTAG
jgi:hypothetical protein